MNKGTTMSLGEIAKLAITDFASLPPGVRHTLQVWLVTILFLTHVAWARGWIPGVTGFAFASDIEAVKHEITELTGELREQRVEYLEERILAAYAERCAAITPDLRKIHQRRLARLLRHYQSVTQYIYPLQPCEA